MAAAANLTGGIDDAGPSSVKVKWVTHKNADVDRGAGPWLIKRFVDSDYR